MKWTKTPDAYMVHSHCNGNDGTNLGWVANVDGYLEAWICNGYESAGYLGHYKTPRLAQMAVERELLKRWFKYEWEYDNLVWNLYVNKLPNCMIYDSNCYWKSERQITLARAKREFLSEL